VLLVGTADSAQVRLVDLGLNLQHLAFSLPISFNLLSLIQTTHYKTLSCRGLSHKNQLLLLGLRVVKPRLRQLSNNL